MILQLFLTLWVISGTYTWYLIVKYFDQTGIFIIDFITLLIFILGGPISSVVAIILTTLSKPKINHVTF